jgi:hypothetical protein
VTFTGPGDLDQDVTPADGTACFTSTTLESGLITASLRGDGRYGKAEGSATATVGAAATTTTVTASPSPSEFGQSVEVCASVAVTSPGTGTATGTVAFTGPGLTQSVALDAGEACLDTTDLTTGTVSATYAGTTGYAGSTGTVPVTVGSTLTPTTTVLIAARTGSSVELCATVTVDAPVNSFVVLLAGAVADRDVPTGTVTFSGLGDLNETVTLDELGMACVTVTDTAGGTASATFNGGGELAGSLDTAVVNPAPVVLSSAPRNVTATAGVSSILASWDVPVTDATVTGYTATASPGPAECRTTGTTSCLLGGVAGTTYTVTVTAQTADGDSPASEPSNAATPTAPAPPPTPPATDLVLTTTDGNITVAEPGQDIIFVGTGFLAFSTVAVTIYSDPIVLGTFTTDAFGNFRGPVTLPEGLTAGEHTVVAQGVAPDGSPRSMALLVTVTITPDGVRVVVLPVTGPPVTVLLIGLVLMIAGAGLVTGGRLRPRRRREG